MPDLRIPDLSRREIAAIIVVVIAGIVAMTVGALSSSSEPNSANPAQNRNRDVEPVSPINPNDPVAQAPGPTDKPINPADPFAICYGKSGLRKVTFRITANGAVNMSVSYRDHKEESKRVVSGGYSKTRMIRGRYPLVAVAIQLPGRIIPGSASHATCTVTIDGVKIAEQTTTKDGALTFCIG
jgi:hypothetical protein